MFLENLQELVFVKSSSFILVANVLAPDFSSLAICILVRDTSGRNTKGSRTKNTVYFFCHFFSMENTGLIRYVRLITLLRVVFRSTLCTATWSRTDLSNQFFILIDCCFYPITNEGLLPLFSRSSKDKRFKSFLRGSNLLRVSLGIYSIIYQAFIYIMSRYPAKNRQRRQKHSGLGARGYMTYSRTGCALEILQTHPLIISSVYT